MRIGLTTNSADSQPAIEQSVTFPGESTFYFHSPTSSWAHLERLEFDLLWPAGAPTNAQVLAHLKDWDHWWYQNLLPAKPVPGRTNHYTVPLAPPVPAWRARGHHGTWNLRALMAPKEVGIRVFGESSYSGKVSVTAARGIAVTYSGPPSILRVRPETENPACFEKFEITFELPDRYPCPFDPSQVRADVVFDGPDGNRMEVPAFYGQDYFRSEDAAGGRLVPQGAPWWKCRFAPRVAGPHVYRINVRDTWGTNSWGPGRFIASPPRLPGYVRVSKTDNRCFEFDNGAFFFPVGHNIRSPYDTRMEEQFPWTRRWPADTSVYARYFKAMRECGETLTEAWSAPWSMGLEWTPRWRGYHGMDQYNMLHAWELDTVVNEAEANNIYLNLVIHNHGKFGTAHDHEWEYNPLNVQLGGYLASPEDYFTDARAKDSFLRLMRYMVARWGYSTRIFAWQLWSELDLTGSDKGGIKNYQRPEVVEWHKWAGREIKAMDPWDHLISTHVCGDYTHQNAAIISLPEIDHAAVDAYHFSPDPLHIVALLKQTAQNNNAFGKPVIVTEFGGSPFAQDVKHLEDTLHAGLWTSACVPLGGAPLFWWWQLIDEENFYPKFKALAAFLAGIDRRNPALGQVQPELLPDPPASRLAVECMGYDRMAVGWIHLTHEFPRVETAGLMPITNLQVRISNLATGTFTMAFWDTIKGEPVLTEDVPATNGTITARVPAFRRDIAFKLGIKALPGTEK